MVRRSVPLSRGERTQVWRVETGLGPVNLMRARYVTQVFAPHFHEGYCLGVIERGALGFRYMGERVVAPAGAVNLAVPGEVHTGEAADARGWTYRMFYLDPAMLVSAASQMAGRRTSLPFIREGVIFDAALADMLQQLHARMTDPSTPLLAKEAGLMAVLTRLLRRYSRQRIDAAAIGKAPQGVDRTRSYIHAHHDRDLSIGELAAVAGLSPYHFIRVFSDRIGLTPHAYLTQVRVEKARQLLLAGEPAAQAALAAGFFDQSHLSRHFTRIVGTTPGRYRNCVQDGMPPPKAS